MIEDRSYACKIVDVLKYTGVAIRVTSHRYGCEGVWIPPTIKCVQRNTSNNANPMKVAAASDVAAAPMAVAARATSFMVFTSRFVRRKLASITTQTIPIFGCIHPPFGV